MKRLKVCVYAICKNEEAFVDRWMDSMDEADLVLATDTGSTDATAARLRARGAVVCEGVILPWRFDAARNLSLTKVPEDADICVSTDLDEYFEPGWRERLEDAWRAAQSLHPGAAILGNILYNWSLRADGSPGVQFYSAKVHGRDGFFWKCPVHEYLDYRGAAPLRRPRLEGVTLSHAPDPSKPRSSYLPLLEMAVREAPEDERMRCYLGREYMFRGEWQKCVDALTVYLSMPSATWGEERGAAMGWIANALRALNRPEAAFAWHLRAVAEAPHMREPLVDFARFCHDRADWPMALFLAEEALKILRKSDTYVNMDHAWDATPEALAAAAAWRMGLLPRALAHARSAAALPPVRGPLAEDLRAVEAAAPQKTAAEEA